MLSPESNDSNTVVRPESGEVFVAITGAIASGKSALAEQLAAEGAHLVDYDALVHQLYSIDHELIETLKQRWGAQIINNDGSVNRQALGQVVFGDVDALAQLGALTHPRVNRAANAAVREIRQRSATPRVIVFDIPLFRGSELEFGTHFAVQVVSEPRVQLERLKRRNGLSEASAMQRISAAQDVTSVRMSCDVIVENNGPVGDLARAAQWIVCEARRFVEPSSISQDCAPVHNAAINVNVARVLRRMEHFGVRLGIPADVPPTSEPGASDTASATAAASHFDISFADYYAQREILHVLGFAAPVGDIVEHQSALWPICLHLSR